MEENDCRLLCLDSLVQEHDQGREIWQRVHKLSRCKLSMVLIKTDVSQAHGGSWGTWGPYGRGKVHTCVGGNK